MASVVSISDEEPVLLVARFTAELAWAESAPDVAGPNVAKFVSEAEALHNGGEFAELAKLLLLSAGVVLEKSEAKDIECVFSVVISLASSCQTLSSAIELSEKIVAALTSNPSENQTLRLKLLFTLYNSLPFTEAKLRVYLSAIRYALDAKISELVFPTIAQLKPNWQSLKDHRELFGELCLLVSKILEEVQGPSQESLAYLIKYLGQVNSEDEKALETAKQYALKACQHYLKSPDIFQAATAGEDTVYLNEFVELHAVRQLSTLESGAPLLQLLQIVLTGDLPGFNKFSETNKKVIEDSGIPEEQLTTKIRLLSLANLASQAVAREVRYAQVQEALQVEADEVEIWAVKAIAAKLLHGVLDQTREVIIVKQIVPQSFSSSDWKQLRADYSTWKDKLGNVSRILKSAKASGGVPQA